MNSRRLGTVLALLLSATVASSGVAVARGFCNVDHAGNEEQQKTVAEAAALFYEGGEHLMGMLKAYERSDTDSLEREAEAAATSFNSSAEAYRAAGQVFIQEDLFATIDRDEIVAMAGQPSETTVNAVYQLAKKGVFDILAGCSEKAEELGRSTGEFPGKIRENPTTTNFSELLKVLSDALGFGATVSATFANAGGETE